MPRRWEHNQYAVELWLQRAVHRAPWRVSLSERPDLILVAANFSLYCSAGRTYQRRLLWDELMSSETIYASQVPMLLPLQYGGCAEPWVGATTLRQRRKRPKGMLLLLDLAMRMGADRRNHSVVSPFLVSQPAELVVQVVARSFAALPWASRKLLFFAGHVPKLYLNGLRYHLWRQLRTDRANATTISSTLACTIGVFAQCRQSDAELTKQPPSFFTSFCHAYSQSHCGLQPPFSSRCGGSTRYTPAQARAKFRRTCDHYKSVDFGAELPDMLLDTRRLSHAAYIAAAARHRFCLVAPGDFASTHKVTEAMAIGGAGGCIPVFVLNSQQREAIDAERDVVGVLPYARWLDYCDVAYLVPAAAAQNNIGAVMRQLSAISAAEAATKLAALRRVRDAFVFRKGSDLAKPSAAEYILSEACAAGRRWLRTGSAAFAPAAMTVSRCTLP